METKISNNNQSPKYSPVEKSKGYASPEVIEISEPEDLLEKGQPKSSPVEKSKGLGEGYASPSFACRATELVRLNPSLTEYKRGSESDEEWYNQLVRINGRQQYEHLLDVGVLVTASAIEDLGCQFFGLKLKGFKNVICREPKVRQLVQTISAQRFAEVTVSPELSLLGVVLYTVYAVHKSNVEDHIISQAEKVVKPSNGPQDINTTSLSHQ